MILFLLILLFLIYLLNARTTDISIIHPAVIGYENIHINLSPSKIHPALL